MPKIAGLDHVLQDNIFRTKYLFPTGREGYDYEYAAEYKILAGFVFLKQLFRF